MVIGLTGKSCSGKDVAASYFAAKGLAVVDVDKLGHEALVANHDLLVETFGKGIEKADGTIDRKALGAIVFSDASQLARLDGISHPWMRSQVVDFIGRHEVSIINCALLERMRLVELCDEEELFEEERAEESDVHRDRRIREHGLQGLEKKHGGRAEEVLLHARENGGDEQLAQLQEQEVGAFDKSGVEEGENDRVVESGSVFGGEMRLEVEETLEFGGQRAADSERLARDEFVQRIALQLEERAVDNLLEVLLDELA